MPTSLFDLTGQTCLVTGGNGGIGLGIAKGLALAGANVAIWGRNEEKNRTALAELEAQAGDGTHSAYSVDVTDESAVAEAMRTIVERHGGLNTVVASAGIMPDPTPFASLGQAQWSTTLRTNLDAVFWTFREACRYMTAGGGGSLVAVSSISAHHGAPRQQAYAATKAAVTSLVRSVAVEYAPDGIRANAILPGWVKSDMTSDLQAWDRFNEKAIGRVPMKRWGEPEDFIGIAIYLASDLSRFHTADSIVIDGGYLAY